MPAEPDPAVVAADPVAAAVGRAEALLDRLPLTFVERAFAREVGGHAASTAIWAATAAAADGRPVGDVAVGAAAAYALAILHDPDGPRAG